MDVPFTEVPFVWFNDTKSPQSLYRDNFMLENLIGTVQPLRTIVFTLKVDSESAVYIKTWATGIVLVSTIDKTLFTAEEEND